MDHHVHAAIATGLRRRGIDCLTAYEDRRHEWEDEDLLNRSNELGRVLFTQDVDLLEITAEWLANDRPFAGLIFGEQLRLTIGQAIRDIFLVASILEPAEMRNHIERIPL